MQPLRIFTIFVLSLLPISAFCALDQQCLNICFATCHDCNYCQYQCNKDLNPHVIHYSDEDTFCELTCERLLEGRLY